MELTLDRVLGIVAAILTVLLVVLDKAGKLKGPLLLWLLVLCAVLTLPLALGNPWVRSSAWGALRISKSIFMASVVCVIFSAIAVWISPASSTTGPEQVNTFAPEPQQNPVSPSPQTQPKPKKHDVQEKSEGPNSANINVPGNNNSVTVEQEPPKASPVQQSSQGNNSPNTAIIGNNNVVNIGDPKTNARLDEITKLLKAQGDRTAPEKLLARYPLGYVIFDIDYKNSVFPYRTQPLLDKWKFDWSTVKFNENTPRDVAINGPSISSPNGSISGMGVAIGGPKKVGVLPLFADGTIAMKAEILAIRENGIVFLIGFTHDKTPTKGP